MHKVWMTDGVLERKVFCHFSGCTLLWIHLLPTVFSPPTQVKVFYCPCVSFCEMCCHNSSLNISFSSWSLRRVHTRKQTRVKTCIHHRANTSLHNRALFWKTNTYRSILVIIQCGETVKPQFPQINIILCTIMWPEGIFVKPTKTWSKRWHKQVENEFFSNIIQLILGDLSCDSYMRHVHYVMSYFWGFSDLCRPNNWDNPQMKLLQLCLYDYFTSAVLACFTHVFVYTYGLINLTQEKKLIVKDVLILDL